MRISRHDDILILFCCINQCVLEVFNFLLYSDSFTAYVHMRVKCYLIIAAASRMKAAASLADSIGQALFYIHVDIFKIYGKIKFSRFDIRKNLFEPCQNVIAIFL